MNVQMERSEFSEDGAGERDESAEARLAKGFSERLRQVIGSRSVLKFSQECGISDSLMRKYLAGSQPGLGKLVRLAEVGGVSVEWLATGRKAAGQHLVSDGVVARANGSGGLAPLFDSNWVRAQERRDTGAFVHAVAMGDAMEPTISVGAPLLLDPQATVVKHDGIYVLRWNGEVAPKRVQIDWGGGVWVRSDNPRYQDQLIPAEAVPQLEIVGRVVWVGKRL